MMKRLVRDKIVCFKDFGISLLLPCYSSPDGSQHPLHTTSDAMPGGDGLGHVVISDGETMETMETWCHIENA